VRVGRAYQAGVLRFHLGALLVSLCGCDPDILLGARPLDAIPDVYVDSGTPEDVSVSDSAPPFDQSISDAGLADRTADSARSDIADRSAIPDRNEIPDAGISIDRGPDLPPTMILWSSDHEKGDLSSWLAGGTATGGGQYGGGATEVSRDQAHGGSYAAKLTIYTADAGDRTARLFRRAVSGGAYYSAWFFFPQVHTPDVWWSIFLFRAHRDPNDIESYVNLWDLDVERPDGGPLTLSFYNHVTSQFTRSSTAPAIPIAQWVHIEAFFNYAPPDGPRIIVWQDGVQVFDVTSLGQSPSSNFYWSVGNGSDGLVPRISTIYIDDAAIATGRLGPGGGG
jgi:hypothetical protein